MLRRLFCGVLLLGLVAVGPAVIAQDDRAEASPEHSGPDRSAAAARQAEISSSKDTRIDLSPPKDDAKKHPESGAAVMDSEELADVDEMHAWDPHKAAKDVEVGDYYFKRKNYRGAMERYKDALVYKPNDAVANFRLAECEEKVGSSSSAAEHYEAYLRILPHGPLAADAQKALERLKSAAR
jgi:tetratricopeptide (TPR) repeat protein